MFIDPHLHADDAPSPEETRLEAARLAYDLAREALAEAELELVAADYALELARGPRQ